MDTEMSPPSNDRSLTSKAKGKRKEVFIDDEITNVGMDQAVKDLIDSLNKIVFDEKNDADKDEAVDEKVKNITKERGATKDRVRSKKKARFHTHSPMSLSFSESPPVPEDKKLSIKKFVERRFSRVGIYSIKDVLMDPNAEDSPLEVMLHDEDVVMKRYESFKKFDIVVDHSDHLFSASTSPMNQPPKDWAEKIQEEWRNLAEHLPETIFVRAYESRMDLLRAVIIGAKGTPYHDGLFFFDVYFPSGYPISPPVIRYHSGGLGINPKLHKCGEVCLERVINSNYGIVENIWKPGKSTMLQLLVTIHDQFLSAKPLFNESGYGLCEGVVAMDYLSLLYSENTLIKSLITMMYTMDKPPKNFEALVVGHFRKRVRDILMSCKAYIEGLQVEYIDSSKGVYEEGSGSILFRSDVASCIEPLVCAFNKIGATEANEFLPLSEKKTPELPPLAPTPGVGLIVIP